MLHVCVHFGRESRQVGMIIPQSTCTCRKLFDVTEDNGNLLRGDEYRRQPSIVLCEAQISRSVWLQLIQLLHAAQQGLNVFQIKAMQLTGNAWNDWPCYLASTGEM